MVPGRIFPKLIIVLLTIFFISCKDDEPEQQATTLTDSFESGSIGEVSKISDTEWELSVADDNDNADLPDSWRCWWYVRMDNLVQDAPTVLTIKNSGWPYYYIPIYTYDQIEWHHFSEDEITQNEDGEIIITKKFDQRTAWLARFYPYTFTDLENYIDTIKGNPNIDIQIPGYTQEGKPIYVFKVTKANTPVTGKKRVFMHARTHSAETPSSFLIEGMVNFLLSDSKDASEILSDFEIYIFPMQNVDGAIAGNYRSTPKSENLEMFWCYDSINPLNLINGTPPEVAVIHQYAVDLMNDGGPSVSMALNLHSSNSEPDICPFFYPHFGSEARGYTTIQASLWNKQLNFINCVASHFGADMIEPIPEEGGGSFADKTYPESWWWVNYKDKVMAMTLEMTYGRSGYAPRWIEPDDLRRFGVSVIRGIRDYYNDSAKPASSLRKMSRSTRLRTLKYPELYPPYAEDEMKE